MLGRSLRTAAVALTLTMALSGCSPAKREVRLEKTTLPPVFTLSGGSEAYSFTVWGPYPDVAAMRTRSERHHVWDLQTTKPKGRRPRPDEVPPIRYGTLPPDFSERTGPAPALVTGKYYEASAITSDQSPLAWGNDKGTRSVCFRVEATAVVEVPC